MLGQAIKVTEKRESVKDVEITKKKSTFKPIDYAQISADPKKIELDRIDNLKPVKEGEKLPYEICMRSLISMD